MVISLSKALIIPDVTEVSKPKGLPIARTNSPTLTEEESPSSAGVKLSASILIIAKSVCSSVPTIVASYFSSLPYKETVIFVTQYFPSNWTSHTI